MIKTQQYIQLLDQLLNPHDQTIKIDIAILKIICSSHEYKKLIDITSILFKLFLTGKRHLSIRELIGQSMTATLQPQHEQEQQHADFFVDQLSPEQLTQLIKQLHQMRKKLRFTIYSLRINQIIDILKQVALQKKIDTEPTPLIADYQLLDQQLKKFLHTNTLQTISQNKQKIDEFLKNPRLLLQGKFSNPSTLQKLITDQIIPLLQRSILSIPLTNHTEREGQLSRILKFIHNHYIIQYQLEIQISKNTLVQTRIYHNKIYKQLLLTHQKHILKSLNKILNEAILTPSSIHIQILLLRILRRLYFLWQYSTLHSSEQLETFRQLSESQDNTIATLVRNPLFLTLRNIALFSSNRDEELKEAAMLCYKIIQDKNDLQLITMLEDCDQIRFLKHSKFYSSKAYVYADEVQKIYEPAELGTLYCKNHQSIPPRQLWIYNILVEKPSSLLCWEFYLTAFDLRFGLYKLEQLRELTLEEYEKSLHCKEILKLQKVQNTANDPNKGHLYLKSGIYRLVFDNTFSMMRPKQLFYCFLHLETNS